MANVEWKPPEPVWKAGDAVRLAVGGPEMLVEKSPGDLYGWVHCVWFDGPRLCRDMFLEILLVRSRGLGAGEASRGV